MTPELKNLNFGEVHSNPNTGNMPPKETIKEQSVTLKRLPVKLINQDRLYSILKRGMALFVFQRCHLWGRSKENRAAFLEY